MRAVVATGQNVEQDVIIEGGQRRQVRKALVRKTKQKYRTEMCFHVLETGKCPFGDLCKFAHSSEELRQQVKPGNFKSAPCKSFFEDGFCNYGVRCKYMHRSDVEKKRLQVFRDITAQTIPSNFILHEVIPQTPPPAGPGQQVVDNSPVGYRLTFSYEPLGVWFPAFAGVRTTCV